MPRRSGRRWHGGSSSARSRRRRRRVLVAGSGHGVRLGLAVIAPVYIGLAVADGRPSVIVVESGVALVFVVVAAAGVTGTAWLLVLGLAAHGVKDAWQQRRQYVSGTRWWPPFCAAVDWIAASIIAVEIIVGVDLH